MNYLLDTHTFLWYINDDIQLSKKAVKRISDQDPIKYVSIASLWEIAIKLNIGKIKLDFPYSALIEHILINGFELLPISFEHTLALTTLDVYHNDPFDRIIIAQAITENLVVISKDKNFSKYSKLQLLW